jgi:hypothetical protein
MGRHRPCTAISSVSTPTSDAKRLANGAPLGQGEAPSGAAGNCHRRGEGRLAQLVERLVYTEDVGSSSLSSPTIPDQPVVTATQMFTLRSALVRQDAPLPPWRYYDDDSFRKGPHAHPVFDSHGSTFGRCCCCHRADGPTRTDAPARANNNRSCRDRSRSAPVHSLRRLPRNYANNAGQNWPASARHRRTTGSQCCGVQLFSGAAQCQYPLG